MRTILPDLTKKLINKLCLRKDNLEETKMILELFKFKKVEKPESIKKLDEDWEKFNKNVLTEEDIEKQRKENLEFIKQCEPTSCTVCNAKDIFSNGHCKLCCDFNELYASAQVVNSGFLSALNLKKYKDHIIYLGNMGYVTHGIPWYVKARDKILKKKESNLKRFENRLVKENKELKKEIDSWK